MFVSLVTGIAVATSLSSFASSKENKLSTLCDKRVVLKELSNVMPASAARKT
jgi:hypothetical protein